MYILAGWRQHTPPLWCGAMFAHMWSNGKTNLHLLELVKKLLVGLVFKLERHLVFSPDRYLKLFLGPGRCHLAK